MKTAMQDLIDELEVSFYDHKKGHYIAQMIVISTIIEKAKKKLEKEQKQIIKAYQNGTCEPYAPLNKSKEYYNNLYNQNQ